MQIKLLKAFLILALLFPLSGCAAIKGADSPGLEEGESFAPGSLAVAAKLRFDDVPVPAGFKLVKDKSFVFQSEGTRVALLKYSGSAKLQNIINFYKEQMLLCNWELLNVVEYGRSILSFERGRESCVVSIESRALKKTVIVSLAPQGKIGAGAKAENK